MLMTLIILGLVYYLTNWRFLKIVIGVVFVGFLVEVAFCIGVIITVGPNLMNMLSDLINML